VHDDGQAASDGNTGVLHRTASSYLQPPSPQIARRSTPAQKRLSLGNTSHVKGVGTGIYEIKIDFGPGYRVYFGKDGSEIVILLGGGTKKKQSRDIAAAQDCWRDYKDRKKGNA
jgi:putative addiction module killer protein